MLLQAAARLQRSTSAHHCSDAPGCECDGVRSCGVRMDFSWLADSWLASGALALLPSGTLLAED